MEVIRQQPLHSGYFTIPDRLHTYATRDYPSPSPSELPRKAAHKQDRDYYYRGRDLRLPPSPPMERNNGPSLPPISTLLGCSDRGAQPDYSSQPHRPAYGRGPGSQYSTSSADPRSNRPPTPPFHPQRPSQRHSPYGHSAQLTPVTPASALSAHEQRHVYGHDAAGGRPWPQQHQRVSSSSSYSQCSPSSISAHSYSPQSAQSANLDPSWAYARSYNGQPSIPSKRSATDYPSDPRSPPSATSSNLTASDYDRVWQHHQSQYGQGNAQVSSGHSQRGSTSSSSSMPAATVTQQLPDRYICPSCAKAFSRPSSLRIHVHSHTGEKPFRCPQPGCGKAFSVRSNMKRHQRGCHVDCGEGGGALSRAAEDMEFEERAGNARERARYRGA